MARVRQRICLGCSKEGTAFFVPSVSRKRLSSPGIDAGVYRGHFIFIERSGYAKPIFSVEKHKMR